MQSMIKWPSNLGWPTGWSCNFSSGKALSPTIPVFLRGSVTLQISKLLTWDLHFTFLPPICWCGIVSFKARLWCDFCSVSSPPYSGLHHTLLGHQKPQELTVPATGFTFPPHHAHHFTEKELRPSHGVSGWPRTQGCTVCLWSHSFSQMFCLFSSLLSHLVFYCQVTLSHSDLSWHIVMSPGCLTHSFQTPLSKPFPVWSHITNIYFLRFLKLKLLFHRVWTSHWSFPAPFLYHTCLRISVSLFSKYTFVHLSLIRVSIAQLTDLNTVYLMQQLIYPLSFPVMFYCLIPTSQMNGLIEH